MQGNDHPNSHTERSPPHSTDNDTRLMQSESTPNAGERRIPCTDNQTVNAKHRLPSTNSFIDSTEARTTSKQDVRTTLWVDEWNALGDRSTEWRDRGIIPNEHLASGTD